MRSMSREQIEGLITTYENGNKSVFYSVVDKMTRLDIVNLISMRQPYHSTITMLRIHFEGK